MRRSPLGATGTASNSAIELPVDVQKLRAVSAAPHRFPIIQTVFQNHRIRCVGNVVFKRPLEESFSQFLLFFLGHLLGQTWAREQMSLKNSRRHVVMRWLLEWEEWRRSHRGSPLLSPHPGKVVPTGSLLSLIWLGYDLYCLYHRRCLPDEMMRRIRDHRQFQGARYEAMVAAIFVRAGFSVHYTPAGRAKRCEFEAIWHPTHEIVGVEAKSRHRPGQYNERGTPATAQTLRGDVENLIRAGLKQRTLCIPFVMFIELNVPPTPKLLLPGPTWYYDVLGSMRRHRASSAENPDDLNALFVTNYSPHLMSVPVTYAPGDGLAILSQWPRHRLSTETLKALYAEFLAYGRVPEDPRD